MLKHSVILLSAGLLLSLDCFCQENRIWTLQDCVDYALENNIEIRQQLLSEQESKVNLAESKWAFTPSLSASTGGTGSTGRVLDPTTYQFVQTNYTVNTSSSISGSVTLFEGGRKIYALKKTQLGLRASLTKTEALRFNIRMNVIASYLDALCAEEQRKSAESTLSKLEAQMERTNVMFEAGMVTESDVLQLKSQLFAAENDVSSAENAYDIARLSLCDLLNIEDYRSLNVTAPGDEFSQLLIDVDKAVEATPEFQSAAINRELTVRDVDLARASLWPTLSLSAGYGSNFSDARKKSIQNPDGTFEYQAYPFFQQYADNASAYASLSLNIPILTGLKANSNLKRAKIYAKNAGFAVESTRKEIRKKIVQAQIDFNTAYDKYNSAGEQLKYAEVAERQICDKYNLGATDFNSWNTSVVELANAKYNLAAAKCTLIMKYEVLKLYADR